jgi:Fe2+ or Zn2+ uptake regulation protein
MQERQTKQKQIIYDALCALHHPTATEVFGEVHKQHSKVSRATVFRVLSGFAASGKALELRSAGSEVRYDYNTHAHCHARCLDCGKLVDVDVQGLEPSGVQASAPESFDLSGFQLEFYGKCESCKVVENGVLA